MASLSEDMRSKRDVRRKSSVLIVDKDLGNYGLYKAILAMEYELECINSIIAATNLCKSKRYDVIIVDGAFNVEDVDKFYNGIEVNKKDEKPILLVLEEQANKESIINFLSIGAREYIDKPFSKEGLTNIIYEQLKKRRECVVRQSILIADYDEDLLREYKSYLNHKYNVSIVNTYEIARQFMENNMPDMVICDMKLFEKCIDDAARCRAAGIETAGTREKWNMPVLVMTDTPDGETIRKCAQFNLEGFLIKPIEEDMLVNTLERIFLVESYTGSGR